MATIKLRDYLASLSSKGSSANNDKLTILDSADGSKIKTVLKSDLVNLTFLAEELREDLKGDFLNTFGDDVISSSIQIDHDVTTNFVANEHIDHTSVSITSGTGLTGGGDISTNRTINVVSANNGIVANADNIELDTTSTTFTTGVKSKLNVDNVVSSSAQSITHITSADLDMSGNKVLFANVYANEVDLPSASTYHGMFAHVHATGKGYYAHAGAWIKLLDESFSSSLDSTYASDSELTAVSSALDSTNNAISARVTAVESFSSSLDSTFASDSELTTVSSSLVSTIDSLTTADVSEDSSNKYYTDVRVKTKLTAEDVVSGSNSQVKTFLGISASDISDVEAFSQSGTYSGLRAQSTTAADVDLGNVTNESKATMFTGATLTGNSTAPSQSVSDNSTKIATTEFVQARITDIIGNAGSTLDTLGELSASLAEDSGSLSTLTTVVGTKLVKASNLSDLQDAGTARTNLGVDAAGTVNYVLPTNLAGDDIDIDTTPLTGATVISDLDINITTNTSGLVTDANGTVVTRELTATDLSLGNVTNESKATMFTSPTFTGTVGGTTDFGGNVSLTGSLSVKGDIMPSAENLCDIGSAAMRWEDMWADQVFGRTLYVDEYLYHNGDGNTYQQFRLDRQTFVASGSEFIDFKETAQPFITIGNGNDTDTRMQGGAGYIFIQGSDGYIGINDATPSYPLEVNANTYIGSTLGVSGAITGSGGMEINGVSNYNGLTIKAGGASRPGINFENVTQGQLGGIFGTEANSLGLSTQGGIEYVVRNANGASGDHLFNSFGTTILKLDGGTNAATFAGDVTINNSAVAKLKFNPLGSTYGAGFDVLSVTGTSSAPYTSTISFSNYGSADALKIIGANSTFAGNVGINTATPQKPLHIEGTGAASEMQILASSASDTVGHTAGIGLRAEGGESDGDLRIKGGIFFEREAGDYGVGQMHFANNGAQSNVSVTVADKALTIAPNGVVGIGTSTLPTDIYVATGGGYATLGLGQSSFLTAYKADDSIELCQNSYVNTAGANVGIIASVPASRLTLVDGQFVFQTLVTASDKSQNVATNVMSISPGGVIQQQDHNWSFVISKTYTSTFTMFDVQCDVGDFASCIVKIAGSKRSPGSDDHVGIKEYSCYKRGGALDWVVAEVASAGYNNDLTTTVSNTTINFISPFAGNNNFCYYSVTVIGTARNSSTKSDLRVISYGD